MTWMGPQFALDTDETYPDGVYIIGSCSERAAKITAGGFVGLRVADCVIRLVGVG